MTSYLSHSDDVSKILIFMIFFRDFHPDSVSSLKTSTKDKKAEEEGRTKPWTLLNGFCYCCLIR